MVLTDLSLSRFSSVISRIDCSTFLLLLLFGFEYGGWIVFGSLRYKTLIAKIRVFFSFIDIACMLLALIRFAIDWWLVVIDGEGFFESYTC